MSHGARPRYDQPFDVEPDEIIVGSPHLRPLLAKLRELHIPYRNVEPSRELGLTRFVLSDARAAAGVVAQQVEDTLGRTDRPGPDLDAVLWGLRLLLAEEFSGWRPLMGKNRVVGHVRGVGRVSYGGGTEDPKPCQPPPEPPSRAAGPGRGVRVGVLDTRLSPQSWLAGGWVAGYSDLLRDTAPPYAHGHATFVTGLVLALAPGALVEARGVLDEKGGADSWSVAQAIVRLGRSGLDVLNLSFVCYTEDGQAPLVLSAAMDRLDPDLVVVAAAGNHGDVGASGTGDDRSRVAAWPAALDDVLAVGACDETGKRAPFSPPAPWVDVLATGVGLRSTYLSRARAGTGSPEDFGGYATWNGTSFSAALVSGLIAAGTEPGRRSASEALQELLGDLPNSGKPDDPPVLLLSGL